MMKIVLVMPSTSMERSKMECAGVAAGEKMLVGDCAYAVPPAIDIKHAAVRRSEAEVKQRVWTTRLIGSFTLQERIS
jgi:hypothetical protein